VLTETGYWPPDIPFTTVDLATVMKVFEDRAKEIQRARR
jgi:hypothetical protein